MGLWELPDEICSSQEETRVSAHCKSAQLSELTANNGQRNAIEKADQDWTREKIRNHAQA